MVKVEGYTYSEIGMLIGAAVGGTLSVMAFIYLDNIFYFLLAAAGMALGSMAGNLIGKRRTNTK